MYLFLYIIIFFISTFTVYCCSFFWVTYVWMYQDSYIYKR